jgi:hypothetical protein
MLIFPRGNMKKCTLNQGKYWGLLTVALGVFFLTANLFPGLNTYDYWPVLLIVAGLARMFWSSCAS